MVELSDRWRFQEEDPEAQLDARSFSNGIEMKEVVDGTIDDDWFMSMVSLAAPKRLLLKLLPYPEESSIA